MDQLDVDLGVDFSLPEPEMLASGPSSRTSRKRSASDLSLQPRTRLQRRLSHRAKNDVSIETVFFVFVLHM